MYSMHFGVVFGQSQPLIEDDTTGYRLRPGRIPEGGAVLHLRTDADQDYQVRVVEDSWESWGQLNDYGSIHVVIDTRNEIGAREAGQIHDALQSLITGGRLVDYSILTNEENWKEVAGYYLYSGFGDPWPVVVQVSPEPLEGG